MRRSNPDVHQGQLIEKIIRFMEIDSRNPLDNAQKAAINRGLCYGLSVVYAYMAATNELEWWKNVLQAVAQWDGLETSLGNAFTLQESTTTGVSTTNQAASAAGGSASEGGSRSALSENIGTLHVESNAKTDATATTLRSVLNRMVNYVLYNFAMTSTNNIQGMEQAQFLRPQLSQDKMARFDSMRGDIVKHGVVAGDLLNPTFEDIFKPAFFAQPEAIYIIHSCNHTCTLRYKQNNWYFYDPNYPEGEKAFTDTAELITEIRKRLSSSLSIEIASWSDGIDTGKFDTFYAGITSDNAQILLKNFGLHMIAHYAPAQLSSLFALATDNAEIKDTLATALTSQTPDGWTGLHRIARYAPAQLPSLLALARNHTETKDALAAALTCQTSGGWTGLHVIARYAPDQLASLFALARDHDKTKDALAAALTSQDSDGSTGLHMIAYYAPAQLTSLLALARDHDKTKDALAAALTSQTPDDRIVGLHLFARIAPDQLEYLLNAQNLTNNHHTQILRIVGLDRLITTVDQLESLLSNLNLTDDHRTQILGTVRLDEMIYSSSGLNRLLSVENLTAANRTKILENVRLLHKVFNHESDILKLLKYPKSFTADHHAQILRTWIQDVNDFETLLWGRGWGDYRKILDTLLDALKDKLGTQIRIKNAYQFVRLYDVLYVYGQYDNPSALSDRAKKVDVFVSQFAREYSGFDDNTVCCSLFSPPLWQTLPLPVAWVAFLFSKNGGSNSRSQELFSRKTTLEEAIKALQDRADSGQASKNGATDTTLSMLKEFNVFTMFFPREEKATTASPDVSPGARP